MSKKLIFLISFLLVTGLASLASAAYLKVDLAVPETGNQDWTQPASVYQERHDRTHKSGWTDWVDGWADLCRHDIKDFYNVDGSGIDVSITTGYEGDGSLKVLGMTFVGDGQDPCGLPLEGSGAIANSYFISHRHWGNQPDDPNHGRYSQGSVFLRFSGGGLVAGDYTLMAYHNCPNNIPWDNNSPDAEPGEEYDWYVDDGNDSIMPSIRVYGPGVTQIFDEETTDFNVPIQHVDDDSLLEPSLVKFNYTGGGGEVTVMFEAAPGADYREGGAGVVNAFILEGGDPGTATRPRPLGGEEDVHPEAVLLWKPGLYADFHDVYFGTDFNDVNDSLPAVLVSERQEPNEYDPNEPDTGSPYLKLGQTYYWRIDEVNDFNDLSPWRGMMWDFTVDDGKAEDPNTRLPGLDPNSVMSKTIAWTPGTFATAHDLYFGTDSDDVNDANTTSPEFVGTFYMSEGNDANIFQIPDDFGLELGESYHWRVDEHNSVYGDSKGDVWGLGVQNYLVIDDFESYGITSNMITDTWYDGIRYLLVEPWFDYINGAALGLGARYPEMEEPDPVRGGLQSMWFGYNNTGQLYSWTFDYYSEATLPFDPPKDLTEYGVKALVLWFYGDPLADANVPQCQMYMALGDDSNNLARIDYGHYPEQDMNDILEDEWFEWNLDIQDFRDQGVDVCDVNKISIGFGYRDGNVPAGIGDIYFDDILVYLPRCVADIIKPDADISRNCKVDIADVAMVARDWLLYDFTVTTEAPPAGPFVQYQFEWVTGEELTAFDSTSNHYDAEGDHDGDPCTPYWETGGKVGRCIKFDTERDSYCLVMPNEAFNDNITSQMTVSVWVRWDEHMLEEGDNTLLSIHGGPGTTFAQILSMEAGGDEDGLGASFSDRWDHGVGGDTELWPASEWNHLALIKDANERFMRICCNGKVIAENDPEKPIGSPLDFSEFPAKLARIGTATDRWHDSYSGYLDDFRIYNYALSQAQVAYLVNGSTPLYIPLESKADLYDGESANNKAVNFRDYAIIAIDWCDKIWWPILR